MTVHPSIRLVVAPNPDAYTLGGTNTWILRDPATRHAVLIDPGPESADHLDAIAAALTEWDAILSTVVLTHFHDDHTDAVAGLRERWDVPVRGLDPAWCRDAEPLRDGEVVGTGDAQLTCLATPGHTFDSVCFHSPVARAIFTGDMVLGGSSTMIDYPDGSLIAYFESMDRLEELALATDAAWLLPGHGHPLPDAPTALATDVAHRRSRLDQVVRARHGGAESADDIVDVLYPGLDPFLREGAWQNVAAALELLDHDTAAVSTTTHPRTTEGNTHD
jgi:glyoxylase-like metal-dependent hydrolase (beta-lactamase superfamily II)